MGRAIYVSPSTQYRAWHMVVSSVLSSWWRPPTHTYTKQQQNPQKTTHVHIHQNPTVEPVLSACRWAWAHLILRGQPTLHTHALSSHQSSPALFIFPVLIFIYLEGAFWALALWLCHCGPDKCGVSRLVINAVSLSLCSQVHIAAPPQGPSLKGGPAPRDADRLPPARDYKPTYYNYPQRWEKTKMNFESKHVIFL